MPKKIIKDQKGMTLIEVIVSILIISVLTVGIYSLIEYVLKLSAENKFRLGAVMVADLKMERIKNLPYDQIGTLLGIVHGNLPDNEILMENNGAFYVNTFVRYIDDPFDGTDGGSPNDLLPTDYKQIRIRVRYNGPYGQKDITVYTNVAPQGMESSVGGGTLSISVFNASGFPVSLADVNIKNSSVSPAIDFTAQTDANGLLSFPGAPASVEGYEISVSKAGYSHSSTSPRTVSNPNPTIPNATVILGTRTSISFTIDILSTINIKTLNAVLPLNWKINTDSSTENQTNSRIAIDSSGNIYIVWQDYRSSADAKIYGQKYNSSRVKQWSSDVVIGNANNRLLPEVKVDGSGNLYVSWSDNSNGNQDCFLSKRASSDGSDLWTGPKKIDASVGNADQNNARIAVSDNGTTTIVWQDNRAGNLDVYMLRYNGAHIMLWASDLKLNTNSDTSDQSEPVVAVNNKDLIFSAWTDKRNGNKDIYIATSSSLGTLPPSANIKINTDSGNANQYTPSLAIESVDNYIYAVWTDERNGGLDIYGAKFDATGTLQWTPDNILISAHTADNQSQPSIAIDASHNIYVVWTDERNGNQDIYAQKLDASGVRQWSEDVRVNINTDDSNQSSPNVTINPSTQKPFVTWQDDRIGNFDIYASEFDSYGSIINVANVPLRITGAKKIGENPVIYKYNNYFTTNGSGDISVPNIEWDSYTIELNNYPGHTIVLSDPDRPLDLTPNTTKNIFLYIEP
jgi:prepilin-type N-terminal cleavage/methylation domain-containing protein